MSVHNTLPRRQRSVLGLVAAWLADLFRHDKAGFLGLVSVVFFVGLAVLGPLVVPEPGKPDVTKIYQPPSLEHPLGTDYEGRDVLTQVLRGGRSIILVAVLAALLSTAIAITFGSLAAYLGGAVDSVTGLVTDVVLTVPQFPLLVVLSAFVKLDRPWLLALLIGLLSWPTLLRAVRAQVLSLKEREYVEAARALGLSTFHILFREILPNMAPYIVMSFTIGVTAAMYAQVGLYFLGLAPLAGENWGIMLNLAWIRGAIFFKNSVLYILAPVLAIALLQLSLVTAARSLEGLFNPRLRES
ncbi:Dipeptide transport system permease protein DppC [bacterium HR27]|nr:Dipeptide transport system permease protein DppC [bacterium HR27]